MYARGLSLNPLMYAHSRRSHGNGMPGLLALMVWETEYHFSALAKTFEEVNRFPDKVLRWRFALPAKTLQCAEIPLELSGIPVLCIEAESKLT